MEPVLAPDVLAGETLIPKNRILLYV